MGSGIAQVAACAGVSTVLRDVDAGALARARTGIEKSTAKLVEKGTLTAIARDRALAGLVTSTDLATTAGADLIIEAITEDAPAKIALFVELDRLCGTTTILASNTSSLSIGTLAAGSGRPDRVIGLHFFNPVPLMPLVEVVRGGATSAETCDRALAFVRLLGKETIEARDVPGFVVNLLLIPYLMDAVRALEQSVASTSDGAAHPARLRGA
jgi:3-hydroxybutyryl-CoA dehydrogenase